MNDEGFIFAGQAFDWERDRYGCQGRVRIEERFKERKGRPGGEMGMNGGEQAGEGVGLLIRKRVSNALPIPGAEG